MNKNVVHEVVCRYCSKSFTSNANVQVFCSIMCRVLSEVLVGDRNQCWLWIGHKDKDGYGMLRWQWKMIRAHRAMFMLANDSDPQRMYVLHSCDTPSCVNPDHLWLGTALDNAKDRDRKGRGRRPVFRGENNGMTKLKTAQLVALRERLATGTRLATLLREVGAGYRHAITGRSWKHIPMPPALAQRYPSNQL